MFIVMYRMCEVVFRRFYWVPIYSHRMLRAQWTLVLNYMIFACLLNTTGVMVARLVAEYGISEIGAALIENSRDLTVSLVSFFVVSRVIRWGARRMMKNQNQPFQWSIGLLPPRR